MRLWALLAMTLALVACESTPVPTTQADPTQTAEYQQTTEQLAKMARDAQKLFDSGKPDQASALIEQSQPVTKTVLSVPHPTLAANEAASDLDELYGRMLLRNRHYGWARLQFQKNLYRWKHWEPQTPDTIKRLRQAESSIAECDKQMAN